MQLVWGTHDKVCVRLCVCASSKHLYSMNELMDASGCQWCIRDNESIHPSVGLCANVNIAQTLYLLCKYICSVCCISANHIQCSQAHEKHVFLVMLHAFYADFALRRWKFLMNFGKIEEWAMRQQTWWRSNTLQHQPSHSFINHQYVSP